MNFKLPDEPIEVNVHIIFIYLPIYSFNSFFVEILLTLLVVKNMGYLANVEDCTERKKLLLLHPFIGTAWFDVLYLRVFQILSLRNMYETVTYTYKESVVKSVQFKKCSD